MMRASMGNAVIAMRRADEEHGLELAHALSRRTRRVRISYSASAAAEDERDDDAGD